MHRKVTYLLLFVIVCFFIPSILAQDKAASDRLSAAHAQYYTPTANGLKSFQCAAKIDWKAMLMSFSETDIPEDNPTLKYLQTVQLSVMDQLKGKGSMEWIDRGAPPEGKEEAVKKMRDWLQTMVEGLFKSWNGYMNGDMVPFPDKNLTVTTAGAVIHLHGTSTSMKVDEDFDQNMLLTQVVVDTPEIKLVAIPTYARTADGLVISSVVSQVNQPPSAPQTEVTFHVEYAKVDSFQIPSHVVYGIKNVGVVEIGFNACQVSLADSTQQTASASVISQTTPKYPAQARKARIQGNVVLHAIIDKEGKVAQLDVISGQPLLVQASMDAVRKWRYKPTLLNGAPVEVDTTITLTFALGNSASPSVTNDNSIQNKQ
jgi:TonB family protein